MRSLLKLTLLIGLIQLMLVAAVAFSAKSLPRSEWNMVAYIPGDENRPTIHLLDIAHRLDHPLPSDAREVHSSPVWSPDGRYLAYVINDARIRLFDTRTFTTRDLQHSIQDTSPIWSADSRTLLFHSFIDRDFSVFAMNIDTGVVEKVIENSFDMDFQTLSPDGQQFAWLQYTGIETGYELFVSDNRGNHRRQVTSDADMEIRFTPISWSPDSRLIVCVTQVNELRALTTINVDTGEVKRILRVDTYNPEPEWSQDNQHIAYWVADNRFQSTLYLVDVDGKNPRRLVSFTPQITLAAWRR